MRHALAPLVVGVLLLSGGLACSGLGSEDEEAPSVQVETPALSGRAAHPYLVGLSGSPWPVDELSNHPLLVVDQDSATAWEASAGDLAVFFTPSLEGVTGARSMGSPAELRLLVKPARGSTHYDVTPWTALPGDGSRMADTPLSVEGIVQGFELRLPEGGRLSEVELLATDAFEPAPTGPWTYYGTRRTSPGFGRFDDPGTLRFGTFDPEACTAERLGGGPEQRLTEASCEAVDGGVQLRGSFPPYGALDETLSMRIIQPCLAVIDGFPMSRKGCRKAP